MIEILFSSLCAIIGAFWMEKKGKSKPLGFFLGLILNVIGLGIIAFMVRTKKPPRERKPRAVRSMPVPTKPVSKGYKVAKKNHFALWSNPNSTFTLNCGHSILADSSTKTGRTVTCDVCKENRTIVKHHSSI